MGGRELGAARLLEVRTHHNDEFAFEFLSERDEPSSVFERRDWVVELTGSDDRYLAFSVTPVQNVTDRVAATQSDPPRSCGQGMGCLQLCRGPQGIDRDQVSVFWGTHEISVQ